MQHSTQLTDLHLGKTWLTIGSFDGVHNGHQELIRQLVTKAHTNGAQAAVLTFHPHPAIVLRGKSDPFYLTSLDEKLELIESARSGLLYYHGVQPYGCFVYSPIFHSITNPTYGIKKANGWSGFCPWPWTYW